MAQGVCSRLPGLRQQQEVSSCAFRSNSASSKDELVGWHWPACPTVQWANKVTNAVCHWLCQCNHLRRPNLRSTGIASGTRASRGPLWIEINRRLAPCRSGREQKSAGTPLGARCWDSLQHLATNSQQPHSQPDQLIKWNKRGGNSGKSFSAPKKSNDVIPESDTLIRRNPVSSERFLD